MELVPAPSLDGVLRESGPLPPDQVARIGLAMLDALRAAHQAGILLRDDPRTRLTAGQASALIESQPTVDVPARTVTAGRPSTPGPARETPAVRRPRGPSRLVLATTGLAALAATAIVLAVTLSSNPPGNQGNQGSPVFRHLPPG